MAEPVAAKRTLMSSSATSLRCTLSVAGSSGSDSRISALSISGVTVIVVGGGGGGGGSGAGAGGGLLLPPPPQPAATIAVATNNPAIGAEGLHWNTDGTPQLHFGADDARIVPQRVGHRRGIGLAGKLQQRPPQCRIGLAAGRTALGDDALKE